MRADHPEPLNPQIPKSLNPRSAFTLIELLVVIVIIGILTGLLVAAAGPVRNLVRNWRMKSEITQLALALERVRNDLGGGQYPPDATNSADWQQFLRRAFPRWNSTNFPAPFTPGNAAEALVFWLGGRRDGSGNFIGFSANPVNPFDTTSTTGRIGPFFEFDRTRIGPGSSGNLSSTLVYYPQNDLAISMTAAPPAAGTAPQPYTYFKAVATGTAANTTSCYNGTNSQPAFNYATPFLDNAAMRLSGGTGRIWIWINPQSFQLLCPGLDGLYGDAANSRATTDSNPPLYPDGSNYGTNTFDDVTNFSRGKLESDMP
jgi:prepilin-type N-terminal cleavage/methylation domain-containing protein